jgi:hypothetical protein
MLTGKSISLPTELMFDENYPEHVDKNLVKVIQKASAIEPENRYSDVKLMQPELNAIIADGEYKKTIFINSNKTAETVFVEGKKPGKKTKFIIIAVLACIIALVVFLAMLMSKRSSDKRASETPAVPKTTEPKVEAKPEVQPPKEVVEKDSIIRGILDSKKPVILNSGSSNGKSKGKDKDEDKKPNVQFILNPAAAISNSKLSISLTSIEVINNDDVIAVLSIQNTAEAALKLDLSKTYLVNGKNDLTKSYNPNSTSLLSIPQSSKKQELKLYFKDFDFEGSTYTLKTVLSSAVNKDINLYVDIK